MAALSVSSCWTLVFSACLVLTAYADCGEDCVTCTYHLKGRQAEINALTCTLGCEGKLQTEKSWDICRDILQGKKSNAPAEEEPLSLERINQGPEHLLAKKYGGFMKRYGGFMKKAAELYRTEPAGEGQEEEKGEGGEEEVDEVPPKRYGGFMKKDGEQGTANSLAILKSLLGASSGEERDGVSKRYGGFMRSLRRSPDLQDSIKELQKRYGGFMRRVGRPDWKEDQKRYGGFLKRSQEEEDDTVFEEIPFMEKRYGGFMVY